MVRGGDLMARRGVLAIAGPCSRVNRSEHAGDSNRDMGDGMDARGRLLESIGEVHRTAPALVGNRPSVSIVGCATLAVQVALRVVMAISMRLSLHEPLTFAPRVRHTELG